jgi:hypothetical protein
VAELHNQEIDSLLKGTGSIAFEIAHNQARMPPQDLDAEKS